MHSFIPSELKFRPMTQVLDGTIFVHSEPVRGIFYTGEDFSRLEIHIRGIRGLLPPIMMILESSFWVEGRGGGYACPSSSLSLPERPSEVPQTNTLGLTQPTPSIPIHTNLPPPLVFLVPTIAPSYTYHTVPKSRPNTNVIR